jgi:queuosine precursor transporter
MTRFRFLTLAVGYLATIIGANWALSRFGIIPVGFGLMAPAGVYFAGLSFGLRDALQEDGGRESVVVLIVIGAGLSWFIEPSFALASGAAFLVGELADLAVYTPLRERQWIAAVVASNLVGSIVDSLIFLGIAFGAITASGVAGLVFGKALMILPALVIVGMIRRRR